MIKINQVRGEVIINVRQEESGWLRLSSPDIDWNDFTDLALEVKRDVDIDSDALIRLEMGSGLSIEDGKLRVDIDHEFPRVQLFWDIRGEYINQKVTVISGRINVLPVVTRIGYDS